MTTSLDLLIHATNIHGDGAKNVVSGLLRSFDALLPGKSVSVLLPQGGLSDQASFAPKNMQVRHIRRKLPHSLSRLVESLTSARFLPGADKVLVLGDIPLSGFPDQVALVHQRHLVDPQIDRSVSTDVKYRIQRWLFRRNIRFTKWIVVQSQVMHSDLVASYPELQGRVKVIPQPAPMWLAADSRRAPSSNKQQQGLRLFYPSAGHSYKNHRILNGMNGYLDELNCPLEVIITLQPTEMTADLAGLSWVRTVGRVPADVCLELYQRADALFFPSLCESYGLPLVEAMTLGLPVLCSDLPFARWLCEDQAIYFDPHSPAALCAAVEALYLRLSAGWQPEWGPALAKLPKGWDEVAFGFLGLVS